MTDNQYKSGKIYTIRYKNDCNLTYVGSTIQLLHKRFYEYKHLANSKKGKIYNTFVYQKIRQSYIEDWYVELYENFPCYNKKHLNKREGEIIRAIGNLHKKIEGRTSLKFIFPRKESCENKNLQIQSNVQI